VMNSKEIQYNVRTVIIRNCFNICSLFWFDINITENANPTVSEGKIKYGNFLLEN
jgi:hypothetical protein